MSDDIHYLVAAEVHRLGFELAEQPLNQLVRYVELLHYWGKRLNLTGDPSPRTVVQHHLADGLVLAHWLQQDSSRWQALCACTKQLEPAQPHALPAVDVGSGAGLPGLVLAISRPELRLTLVEPNARKCSFLRTAAHELQLAVTLLRQRIEQVQLLPQVLACSRATFAPARWLELSASLLTAGGLAVAFVVHPEEIPPAPATLSLVECQSYALADGTPRALAVFVRQPSHA